MSKTAQGGEKGEMFYWGRGAEKSIVRAGGADGAIARGERREAARNPGEWRGNKSSPEGAIDYAINEMLFRRPCRGFTFLAW
jgi:hypothetical protein